MPRPPYLTKSRFKLATECPRKLAYTGRDQYANTRADDEFLQQLAEGGYQVGELAKRMFPTGREIAAQGHQAQLAETADALQSPKVTLFEAALRHERLFARIDVLVKTGTDVQVIEVKSKSYDPEDEHFFVGKRGDLTAELRPYLLDVAFQTLVVRRALPHCTVRAALMLPDKSRRATVDGLNTLFPIQRLDTAGRRIEVRPRPGLTTSELGEPILTVVDVTEHVDRLLSEVLEFPGAVGTLEQLAQAWARAYENDEPIPPPVGAQCKRCEFRAPGGSEKRCGLTECWQTSLHLSEDDLRQPLVIDLWNGRRVDRWMQSRKYRLQDLQRDDLGDDGAEEEPGISRIERQWLQVSGEGLDERGWIFHPDIVAQAMGRWRYPLNLIDFETSRTALPFHRGQRPFGLVAFQFSHHLLHEDGTLVHAGEFLCTEPGVEPNLHFLRALRSTLAANDGTVLMWSPYENSVLNELGRQLSSGQIAARDPREARELINFIDSLTTRKERGKLIHEGTRALVDMKPLCAAAFFHRRTAGSNSIKQVLPAMLDACDELRRLYEQPTYGGGKPNSRNFHEPTAWWVPGPDGRPLDPYQLLPPVFADLTLSEEEEDDYSVSHGGAALYVYARLQFEDITDEEREAWNRALLRYCELDTLAMAMIVQGWRAWMELGKWAEGRHQPKSMTG